MYLFPEWPMRPHTSKNLEIQRKKKEWEKRERERERKEKQEKNHRNFKKSYNSTNLTYL